MRFAQKTLAQFLLNGKTRFTAFSFHTNQLQES